MNFEGTQHSVYNKVIDQKSTIGCTLGQTRNFTSLGLRHKVHSRKQDDSYPRAEMRNTPVEEKIYQLSAVFFFFHIAYS